jgi:hypothetical protein
MHAGGHLLLKPSCRSATENNLDIFDAQINRKA